LKVFLPSIDTSRREKIELAKAGCQEKKIMAALNTIAEETIPGSDHGEIRKLLIIFPLTFVTLCFLVIIFPYEIKDPDSAVYSQIGWQLAHEPLKYWCAPLWQGHDNDPLHPELFIDHPPGMFWIIACLIRAGFPGRKAGLGANFLFIFLSLYFLFCLGKRIRDYTVGWAVLYGYVFSPIFLLYLIRANLEHPMNLAMLAGIYGFIRSEESWKYKVLFALSFVLALFIKGIMSFLLLILALCSWFLFSRKREKLALMVFSFFTGLIFMGLFEIWYLRVTGGVSFWKNYLLFQGTSTLKFGFSFSHMIANFFWYLGRALFFAAPWVFFLPLAIYKSMKSDKLFLQNRLFQFFLTSSFVIILFFSLIARRADRYIFSAYCFLIAGGIWALLYLKPKIGHYLAAKKRQLPLYLSLALILLTLLRIYFHSFYYRFIKF